MMRSTWEQAGVRRGERHGRAKLLDRDVEMIRQLDEAGMVKAEIARKFGVARETIRDICHYRIRVA